jgi:MerR family transcriptional regulator, light-induced transcriptional regulator
MSVFEQIINSSKTRHMVEIFGEDGVYDQLLYHQKLLLVVCEFKSSPLLNDYMRWRYQVVMSRGISPEYFAVENNFWVKAIQTYLFEAYSSEFVTLYHTLLVESKKYEEYGSLEGTGTADTLIPILVHALINGDEEGANALFRTHLNRFNSPTEFLDTIVKPSMVEVGRLWECNKISVAKEHIATAIMERLWDHYREGSSSSAHSNGVAFVITPEKQLHKLGSKMVAALLHQYGWKVAQLELAENFASIFDAVTEFRPKLIICSATMAIYIPMIQRFIDELYASESFFNGKIGVGGQAFYRTSPPIILEHVDFQGEDLKSLENYIKTLQIE